jgi:DNA-binding PadR family transcriptional regulator
MDGDDMMHAGRILAQGDLRLIALALIAEQPRHGYEIIKLVEEKTAGWYSPSPGIVYPTLTYLEDVGYVTVETEGSKKLYTITDEGRDYLEANRALTDAVLERLDAFGKRVARMRRDDTAESGDASMPRSVRGAIADLSEAASELLRHDRDANVRVITAIERATAELRRR